MAKLSKSKRTTSTLVPACVLVVSLTVCILAAAQIVNGLAAYSDAAKEYDGLRQTYATLPEVRPLSAEEAPAPSPADVNADYVGWIRIDGTALDYPVVQGQDNSHYLTTSFLGADSKLGAIFLDFRCGDGLDSPHAILYGHNAKDGSMFRSLLLYLEDGYLEAHPEIIITLPEGGERVYRIFDVRATDVADSAYRLDFDGGADFLAFAAEQGAPAGTGRILALSTCLDNSNLDNRLLVLAAPDGD